ncbi:excinuclease [Shewanella psychrotolerans]|uniref:excinuclease n=1 Tax=Shewanella psychrotolerans TaxID=2864206 RepID=UPI001C65E958|nr:excinuclease [Shewanella psychrotolerans]QYK02991.1 excinuclease [Shewanella psychrotolerans]
MKKITILGLSLLTLFSSIAYARNDIGAYSISEALSSETAKAKLGNEVQFYFGEQVYAEPLQKLGDLKTNKKTNAFNKSDKEACEWVFLSAMIALKKSAVKQGGNAIVNIKSNYKNNLTSSEDTFQCGAGAMIAGVALTGEVVKLAE